MPGVRTYSQMLDAQLGAVAPPDRNSRSMYHEKMRVALDWGPDTLHQMISRTWAAAAIGEPR